MTSGSTERIRLDASKAALQAYKILTDAIPKQEDDDAEKLLRKQLETFKAAKGVIVRATESAEDQNGSKSPLHPHHAAPDAGRVEGRDPDRPRE